MYTIKHAAQLTGIPADTLRMWERRYGVVTPIRNQGGYRLYDDAAIARLTAMARTGGRRLGPPGSGRPGVVWHHPGTDTECPRGAANHRGEHRRRGASWSRSGTVGTSRLGVRPGDAHSRLGRRVRPARPGRSRRLLADARAPTPWRRLATRRRLGGCRTFRQRRGAPPPSCRTRRAVNAAGSAARPRGPCPRLTTRARRPRLRGAPTARRLQRHIPRLRYPLRQLGSRSDSTGPRRGGPQRSLPFGCVRGS